MNEARPILRVLTGCTATGKTDLAVAWAASHGAEIVSCDSLLFYRGMDIGTAKPDPAVRARVPHHLVDVCEPAARMDVKTYADLARGAVRATAARGHPVLVVGGSGFYLRSFFAPVADDVPADLEIRAGLEATLAAEGLPALIRKLETLNPSGLGALDTRNPRRVLRALERCLVSGRTLAELAASFRAQAAPFADWRIDLVEVARKPEELTARIEARATAMVAGGLIGEVRRLRAAGFEVNPAAAGAIGYRETLAWLDAGGTEAGLIAAIAASTRKLVRKQRTWFRSQLPPHRVVTLRKHDAGPVDLFGE